MEKVKLSKKTTVALYRQMEVEKDRKGLARFLRERFTGTEKGTGTFILDAR